MSKIIFLGIVSLLFTGLLTGKANADTDTSTYSQSSDNGYCSPNVIGNETQINCNIYTDNSNNSYSEESDRDTRAEESPVSSSTETKKDKYLIDVQLPSPSPTEFP